MTTTETIFRAGVTATELLFTCAAPPRTSLARAGIAISSKTDNPTTNYGARLGGLQHLTVYGPALSSSPYGNSESVGIYLGGDPTGIITTAGYYGDNVKIEDVLVLGFITGVQMGHDAFLDSFTDSRFKSTVLAAIYAPGNIGSTRERRW